LTGLLLFRIRLPGVISLSSLGSLGLADCETVFAPGKITFGSGVMKRVSLLMNTPRSVIREICTDVPSKRTYIALTSLRSDADLPGAGRPDGSGIDEPMDRKKIPL
jgi:hypothetical protein